MSAVRKLGVFGVVLATAGFAANAKGGDASGEAGEAPAVADIPGEYAAAYRSAAGACPGLDWALLAGIGKVETNHGRLKVAGVRSGANSAGAKGPMQFLPDTFESVRDKHPDVGGDIYDPADAVPAAAHYLCDSGLRSGSEYQAIYAYNHAGWYVAKVQAQAAAYRNAA